MKTISWLVFPSSSYSFAMPLTDLKVKREKGQTTAIVTGAISIVLGIGYLVLVQLLDTRGIKLEPPPPEAFGP